MENDRTNLRGFQVNGLGMVGNLLAGAVGGNVLPMILQAVMGGEGMSF